MSKIKTIADIISDIKEENFEISRHAFVRSLERNIDLEQIIRYADSFIIIEDYLKDKYSHSCLLLGYIDNLPIHLQVTRDSSLKLKIITLYNPENEFWFEDFKRRR
jgi:hypothetical protein